MDSRPQTGCCANAPSLTAAPPGPFRAQLSLASACLPQRCRPSVTSACAWARGRPLCVTGGGGRSEATSPRPSPPAVTVSEELADPGGGSPCGLQPPGAIADGTTAPPPHCGPSPGPLSCKGCNARTASARPPASRRRGRGRNGSVLPGSPRRDARAWQGARCLLRGRAVWESPGVTCDRRRPHRMSRSLRRCSQVRNYAGHPDVGGETA